MKKKFEFAKNHYAGERAFILGNGPSLLKHNLSYLKNEYTFATNRIYLIEDKLNFIPDFYVVEDLLVALQNADEINNYKVNKKFFGNHLKPILKDCENTIWYNLLLDYSDYDNFPHFSKDASKCLWAGGTVTYQCIQLAYFLGFDEVYLIGFDHSGKISPNSVIQNNIVKSDGNEQIHFISGYIKKGYIWHIPQWERMEKCYRKSREIFESDKKIIKNASIGGNLNVFERIDYNSLFNKSYLFETKKKENYYKIKKDFTVNIVSQGNGNILASSLDRFSNDLSKFDFEVNVINISKKNSVKLIVESYQNVKYYDFSVDTIGHLIENIFSISNNGKIIIISEFINFSGNWFDEIEKLFNQKSYEIFCLEVFYKKNQTFLQSKEFAFQDFKFFTTIGNIFIDKDKFYKNLNSSLSLLKKIPVSFFPFSFSINPKVKVLNSKNILFSNKIFNQYELNKFISISKIIRFILSFDSEVLEKLNFLKNFIGSRELFVENILVDDEFNIVGDYILDNDEIIFLLKDHTQNKMLKLSDFVELVISESEKLLTIFENKPYLINFLSVNFGVYNSILNKTNSIQDNRIKLSLILFNLLQKNYDAAVSLYSNSINELKQFNDKLNKLFEITKSSLNIFDKLKDKIQILNIIANDPYNEIAIDAAEHFMNLDELTKAEELIQKNDLFNAQKVLNEIILENENNLDALIDLSVVETIKENYKNSKELLELALSIDPSNQVALDNLNYIKEISNNNHLNLFTDNNNEKYYTGVNLDDLKNAINKILGLRLPSYVWNDLNQYFVSLSIKTEENFRKEISKENPLKIIRLSYDNEPLKKHILDPESPWLNYEVPNFEIPGMIELEEKKYYQFITKFYSGIGAAIELGPWLGCSTSYIVDGLKKNPNFKNKFFVFDDFIWRSSWMDSYYNQPDRPLNHNSFLHLFEKFTFPIREFLEVDQVRFNIYDGNENVKPFKWNNGRIELAFIDCGRNFEVNETWFSSLEQFFIPNKTLIILQDWQTHKEVPVKWYNQIKLFTDSKADKLELIHELINGGIATFLYKS
ncbi:MAG: DUF115 domain-containing protein [Ignavibacterium sp.]|nr:DUF115 domain-containing protein [Ignavibacterium sp.]MDW8376215.1 DUF115 domain-containing protein [Ignavibacteriales bacterium]